MVLVSEGFARKFFCGEDPVGRRLTFDEPREGAPRLFLTVVGVVGDVMQQPTAPQPELSVRICLIQKTRQSSQRRHAGAGR